MTDRLGAPLVALFAIVVVVAGVTGVVLVIAPGATDDYFSWTLRPPAAAAVIGGLYVASAVLFGWALTLPKAQARVLLVGVLGLAVPTLVLTIIHDEVFDFGRWQAVAWTALFVGAPASAIALLASTAGAVDSSPALPPWIRVLLGSLAVVLLSLAVLVWLDATRDDVLRSAPFDLLRLTGTYLGAWCSFLGVLCAWAAVVATWDAARVPLAAVALAAGGVIIGLLRELDDLRRPALALAAAGAVGVGAAITYVVADRGASATAAP